MGPEDQRQRSETIGSAASSRRPKSRASTTSAHSASTQAAPQYQHNPSHANLHTHPNNGFSNQYVEGEMPLRPDEQMSQLYQGLVGEQLSSYNGQQPPAGMEQGLSGQLQDQHVGGQWHPYDGRYSQPYGQTNEGRMQDESGTGDNKKKKGSASSMANDQELRRLYRENKGRSLKEVASQVLANERGPRSEKTKQIFAMLWLAENCRKSTNSVPRNRVFSHYATQCGTERVAPLNPASFGKLVRIIFPGIQTRRLGMRGESKYHYVDLSLVDDQSSQAGGPFFHATREGSVAPERPGIARQRSLRPADTAAFPSPDLLPEHTLSGNIPIVGELEGSLFLDNSGHQDQATLEAPDMFRRSIRFPPGEPSHLLESEPLELPGIQPYVPSGTDPDAAEALTALYRSHCISVIDSFRFCKEKMLWHHFSAFHGTLTVPVQKLFANPDIAPWIKACDFLMYQKMISFVSPLVLQVVPLPVLKTFKAISSKLTRHIISVFQLHPLHVRKARLLPATLFANLLDRLARVNESAHAAANMLTNEANREQMWQDWVHHVRAKHVAQDTLTLRTAEMLKIVDIIIHDVRELLTPLTTYDHPTALELYINPPRYFPQDTSSYAAPPLEDPAEGILERWANFLQSLPARFPKADGKMIIHYMTLASNAAIRDITVAQALSFGSWWITKVWLDEMLLWLVENAGFMDYDPADPEKHSRSTLPVGFATADDAVSEFLGDESRPQTAMSGSAVNNNHSRMGSMDGGSATQHQQQHHERVSSVPPNLHTLQRPELPRSNSFRVQGQSAQISPTGFGLGLSTTLDRPDCFRSAPVQLLPEGRMNVIKSQLEGHDVNEDSGIVLDDDPSSLAKFDGFVADNVGHSDPINVVVC